MKLYEILETLSQGELRSLALGGMMESGITPEHLRNVIPHINLGIQALHKRFPIKNDIYNTQVQYGVNSYKVPGRVLHIEEVYINGELVACNDFNEPGFAINGYDSVEILNPVGSDTLAIKYRATPDNIDWRNTTDPEDVEVELPIPYLEALCYFVGSRMTVSTKGNESQMLISKYENECNRLESLALTVNHDTVNMKLVNNGWV